jgi:hypothetical protein
MSSNATTTSEAETLDAAAIVSLSLLSVFASAIFIPLWCFYCAALGREAFRRWPAIAKDGCLAGCAVPVAVFVFAAAWPAIMAWDFFAKHYNDDLEQGFTCCGLSRRALGCACPTIVSDEAYFGGVRPKAETIAGQQPAAQTPMELRDVEAPAVRRKDGEVYQGLPTEDVEAGPSTDPPPAYR